ncbi:MAG TPA: thioredoxin domain-containing protein [Nocardioides sp.]|uniref:thioredoxin family protein n=1 Tax=Nocardioides sp. TaxID=35761 RepID=UPI002E371DAE|nr:thioredoxin domain-containing protein [Nocardioides sp.]HEX5087956.1 thioredoxin domain-containing protein [Nocardioides sp.]
MVKVNADDNPEVSQRFEVQSIPTLVLLDHGQVVDKQIGALPEHVLRSWLESKLPTRT